VTSAIVSLAKPAHTVGLTKNKTNNTIVKMFIKNSGGTIHCLQLFVSGITFFVLVYFLKQNIIIFYLSSFFFFFLPVSSDYYTETKNCQNNLAAILI